MDTTPDEAYARADPMLRPWSASNGLHVATRFRDDVVRSIPVVDATGREFQIFLEPVGQRFVVRATNNRRKKERRSWASDAVDVDALTGALDDALAAVRGWMREG